MIRKTCFAVLAAVVLAVPTAQAQEMFLDQVDGPCTNDGAQWIGGFVGAFLEDGFGQATLRTCGQSGPPILQLICPHRGTKITVSLTLPSRNVSPRLPMAVDIGTADQRFRFAGFGQTDGNWPRMEFEVDRNGAFIAALTSSTAVSFDVGRFSTTLGLAGSSRALDAMERACIPN